MFNSMERYKGFMQHLPENARDQTLIALKGHLLLESCLREYICNRVNHPDRFRKKQHNFSTLIDFASCLEDDDSISWVWSALRKANKIRNQLAHQLEPEKIDILQKDFIDYVEMNDGKFSVSTDREMQYEKLALIYFQLFDVMAIAVRVKGVMSEESNIALERMKDSFNFLAEGIKATFKLNSEMKSNSHPPYKPARSKKAKRVW